MSIIKQNNDMPDRDFCDFREFPASGSQSQREEIAESPLP